MTNEELRALLVTRDTMDLYVRSLYEGFQQPYHLFKGRPLIDFWSTPKKGLCNFAIQGTGVDLAASSESDMTALSMFIKRQITDALGVDSLMLTQEIKPSSLIEHELTYKAVRNSVDDYLSTLETGNYTDRIFAWTVEDYILVYINKRPAIILCGTGMSGYMETAPRRFSSARRARLWARKQLDCFMLDFMITPKIEFINIPVSITYPARDFDTGRQTLLVRDPMTLNFQGL